MTHKRQVAAVLVACILALTIGSAVRAEPLAERYLIEGKLAEGEKACIAHLVGHPEDDEARLGLAAIQFLLTFEHFGSSLFEYGLRPGRGIPGMTREMRRILPANPNAKKVSYEDVRMMLKTVVDDLARTDRTLAKIKNPNVKLPLHVGLIKIDIFGIDKPISAGFVVGEMDLNVPKESLDQFVITFDRGDVEWLRGYCHFLSGVCELALAVDAHELFECTGHVFFEKVDTPHKFLLEEERFNDNWIIFRRTAISDIIAFIHQMRFPLKEPERMKASLEHFEATIYHSRQMWVHYDAEDDDDNEWIPNPQQTGAMRIRVSRQMITTWLETVDEAELVLKGKKLIPFWRGGNEKRGVNLRRVFTEPRIVDPILWMQGTAATPYLEEGEITEFANPRTWRQLNETFGGVNFVGFAFWFN